MTASNKTALLGAALAFALAAYLGGPAALALFAGYAAGVVAGLGIGSAQRALARGRPGLLLHLVAAGFLAKVFLLLVVVLAVRFAGFDREVLDGRSFAIALAGALLLLVPAGTIDLARTLNTPAPNAEHARPLQPGAPGRARGSVS